MKRNYWQYDVVTAPSVSNFGSTTRVSAHLNDPAGLGVELLHENCTDAAKVTVRYPLAEAVDLARLLITAAYAVDPVATEKLITGV